MQKVLDNCSRYKIIKKSDGKFLRCEQNKVVCLSLNNILSMGVVRFNDLHGFLLLII